MKFRWLLLLLYCPLAFPHPCEDDLVNKATRHLSRSSEFNLKKFDEWVHKGVDEVELLRHLHLNNRLAGIYFLLERDPTAAERIAPSLSRAMVEFQYDIEHLQRSDYFVHIWNTLHIYEVLEDRKKTFADYLPDMGELNEDHLLAVFDTATHTWKGAVTGYMLWKNPRLGARLEEKWMRAFREANHIERYQLIHFIQNVPIVATPQMMKVIIEELPSRSYEYNITVAQALRETDLTSFWKAARPIFMGTETTHGNAMLSHVRLDAYVLDPSKYAPSYYFATAPGDFDAILMRLLAKNVSLNLHEAVVRVIAHLALVKKWSELTQTKFVNYLDAWLDDPHKAPWHFNLILALAIHEPLSDPYLRKRAYQALKRTEKTWAETPEFHAPITVEVLQKAIARQSN